MASSYLSCYLTAVVFLMYCLATTVAQENSTFEPGNNTVVETTLNPTTTFAQENSIFHPGNNTFVGTTFSPTAAFAQESLTFHPGRNTVVGTTLNPTTTSQQNSTFQPGNNTFVGCKINIKTLNGTNNSTVCNLHVDKSKIKDILSKHDNSTTTNIVNIKISVGPGNKTRYSQKLELPWANENGRTIISLVRRARDTIFTSPLFTLILEIGTEEVDIQIMEEIDCCLPHGKEGTDQIFDFLLHQLSHSEDKHVFKLCRIHDDESIQYTTYNCCRITGDRNLTICADYSSAVVEYALPVIIAVFFISFFMILPFVFEHIITYPTVKFYKTSDSHMSLISFVSLMLFESSAPAMSFFRRCVFVGLSSLVFLPDFFGCPWLAFLFGAWAVFFVLLYNFPMRNEECPRLQWDKNIISYFTLPFSLYYTFSSHDGSLRDSSSRDSSPRDGLTGWIYGICICILTILYFIICVPILVAVCLAKFILWDVIISFTCQSRSADALLSLLIRFATWPNIVFFTGMISIFAISTVVGFTLNAEYFNPIIALIVTLVAYFWKNWNFFVEAECLELKTSIIEVCKEKAPKEDEQNSENPSANINTENNNELTCCKLLLNSPLCSFVPCTCKSPDNPPIMSPDGQANIPMVDISESKQTDKASTDQKVEDFATQVKSDEASTSRSNAKTRRKEEKSKATITNTKTENYSRGGQSATNKEPNDNSVPPEGGSNEPLTSGNGDNKLIMKFDKHGEAMISKELYEKVSKEILPLEHLLFYFFRRVIFVVLYAFVMFTVLISARDSGVSESVQIIGAIAGAVIPLVFDTIFADLHLSQRTSKNMATKERLEHILKVNKRGKNNTIVVELLNIADNESENVEGCCCCCCCC